MKAPRFASVAGGLLLLAGGCADAAPPEGFPAEAAEQAETPGLEGGYRFAKVNGQAPPLEWPAGSGAMLESGTLELDSVGRFTLRFIVGGSLGSEPSGQQGTYRVSADSLYFTPEGANGSPLIFQFELDQGGELRMRDDQQNLWTYTRRRTAA